MRTVPGEIIPASAMEEGKYYTFEYTDRANKRTKRVAKYEGPKQIWDSGRQGYRSFDLTRMSGIVEIAGEEVAAAVLERYRVKAMGDDPPDEEGTVENSAPCEADPQAKIAPKQEAAKAEAEKKLEECTRFSLPAAKNDEYYKILVNDGGQERFDATRESKARTIIDNALKIVDLDWSQIATNAARRGALPNFETWRDEGVAHFEFECGSFSLAASGPHPFHEVLASRKGA